MILDGYLNGGKGGKGSFAQACKSAGGWYGLDLFAGTGLNWSSIQQKEIPGSPLIALNAGEPEAVKVVMAEKHEGAFKALSHRTKPCGSRGVSLLGDANEMVEEMLAHVVKAAPAFAFLDPEGSELAWSTVERIADHKRGVSRKIEQLILFPTDMGFVRLAPDYPDKVTNMFGHDRWEKIYAARKADKLSADEARGAYVKLYAEGLTGLGYETVLDRQIAKEASKGGQTPMYFLIFATDHDAGESIMGHCFDRVRHRVNEELGQQPLFPTVPAPRRKRLDES